MRITKSNLKKIINEEFNNLLKEQAAGMFGLDALRSAAAREKQKIPKRFMRHEPVPNSILAKRRRWLELHGGMPPPAPEEIETTRRPYIPRRIWAEEFADPLERKRKRSRRPKGVGLMGGGGTTHIPGAVLHRPGTVDYTWDPVGPWSEYEGYPLEPDYMAPQQTMNPNYIIGSDAPATKEQIDADIEMILHPQSGDPVWPGLKGLSSRGYNPRQHGGHTPPFDPWYRPDPYWVPGGWTDWHEAAQANRNIHRETVKYIPGLSPEETAAYYGIDPKRGTKLSRHPGVGKAVGPWL